MEVIIQVTDLTHHTGAYACVCVCVCLCVCPAGARMHGARAHAPICKTIAHMLTHERGKAVQVWSLHVDEGVREGTKAACVSNNTL